MQMAVIIERDEKTTIYFIGRGSAAFALNLSSGQYIFQTVVFGAQPTFHNIPYKQVRLKSRKPVPALAGRVRQRLILI